MMEVLHHSILILNEKKLLNDQKIKKARLHVRLFCGEYESRTRDLLHAMQAL